MRKTDVETRKRKRQALWRRERETVESRMIFTTLFGIGGGHPKGLLRSVSLDGEETSGFRQCQTWSFIVREN